MMARFADAYFHLALLNPRDAAHPAAKAASASLSGSVVTTHWVLAEVADAFSAPRDRPKFLNLMAELTANPEVVIVTVDDNLFARSVDLYRRRRDKNWPLTDCLSFVVMQDRGIIEAYTGDAHFGQAGFTVLL